MRATTTIPIRRNMSDLPYSAVAGDATCGFLHPALGVLGSI